MKQLPHPAPDEITLTGILGALSDPVRLSIIAAVADGEERPWGEFDVEVGLSTLSHHMKVLREAGLINHRKEGTRCYVALRPDVDARFPGLLASVLQFADGKATARGTDRSGPRSASPAATSTAHSAANSAGPRDARAGASER